MSFLISTAHAAPAAAQPAGGMAMQFVMIAVFIAIFYFLIWRPQAKRAKEHRSLIESLGVGSEIVFAGGLMGKITKLDGDFAVVELSRGVDVKIQRASVISVLPEGTLNNL
ncbi:MULTISPECIES: preprotein translocase subunit YajC [unclassified Acinetobacter]|uniref:preprotein translocase subunit YajC n=1 Tax=unclassified Acinetobacter TaxID=196816 RepID=UPI0022ABF2A3|nr:MULTISPECIES: preprotein translocase subunit YajC [unclassified Acinetobacter]WAU72991.1 preprotein translocase subunit YajC [Acinetobacter sp. TR11]WAU76084.1 preprotein translocase subunit YajC [Acinetobacter sp. TR3]